MRLKLIFQEHERTAANAIVSAVKKILPGVRVHASAQVKDGRFLLEMSAKMPG